MFGGKKAKELEEELLALQEKQNRLQEQISNIAKAKDSAEETLVQMTISKTELDETITGVSEELELLKECSEANSGQTVLLKQQLAKKNEQNIRLQQEKEALCQQMEGEHDKIAKVVEKNKYVTTPMKEIESFYEAYCQERESVEEALQKLADILGRQLACTRPVTEAGWLPTKCQIGLSGRTVRPKLIITCGVSGSNQRIYHLYG